MNIVRHAPWEESRDFQPARLGRFAPAWRAATPDLRTYKRLDLYDDLAEGFLAKAGACP